MTRAAVIAVATLVLGGAAGQATAEPSATTLRLDGIGPLKLGMTRAAAVRTGWLSHRGKGCPLGGPPLPVTYRLTGSKAPNGVIAGTFVTVSKRGHHVIGAFAEKQAITTLGVPAVLVCE